MTDAPPGERQIGAPPAPALPTPYRTQTCGALRAANEGERARLAGWVHRRRDHGQLIFLDLRDRYGITQVVVDRTEAPEAHAVASRVRGEFVVTAGGTGSPVSGATVMAAFWVGTVPLLLGVGVGARALARPVARHLPVAGAVVVLVLGALSIAGKLRPLMNGAVPAHSAHAAHVVH